MLRDFGRALSDAISESSDASRKLREIRDSGYSLYLLLDGERLAESAPDAAPVRQLPAGEPEFRIDGKDLSFLRSIGIDPTRRRRSRRS